MAAMTEVAAGEPTGPTPGSPIARDAEEIAAPTPDNRMVAYPYTKLMTSIMDVDMAAAVLLASAEKADALGVPEDSGSTCAATATPRTPSTWPATPSCGARPPWRRPAGAALGAPGIGIDDVAHLDLYSCFASSRLLRRSTPSASRRRRPGLAGHRRPAASRTTAARARTT